MNEYEVVAFSCFLDKVPWKYQEHVRVEEARQLDEFTLPSAVETTNDGGRLIIYLLLIGFSLKVRITVVIIMF